MKLLYPTLRSEPDPLTTVPRRALRVLTLGVACAALGTVPAAAQKTDTLRFRNGDRVLGEIKGLSRALLRYSTDNMQTVSIEWEAVASLVSRQQLEVEVQSGTKYYGTLVTAPAGYLVVAGAAGADTLPLGIVARMVPMSQRVVSRLDGYVDLGFTYQQANHILQLTVGSKVAYRGPRFAATLLTSYYVQDQDSLSKTMRSSAGLSEQLFLKNRWSAVLSQTYERNEELELEDRVKLGAGMVRVMAQSDAIEFSAGGGAVVLRERYTGQNEFSTTIEGQVGATFDAFRYNQPKLDLSTSLMLYPGISEWGRIRSDFDTRISYELIKDFFLTLSLFHRFDSRPPSETAARTDFGTTLSISWSF